MKPSHILIIIILCLFVVTIFAVSGSIGWALITITLVSIGGATQFFGRMLFRNVARSAGKAFFEDEPVEEFDADAAFERAMRKRSEQ